MTGRKRKRSCIDDEAEEVPHAVAVAEDDVVSPESVGPGYETPEDLSPSEEEPNDDKNADPDYTALGLHEIDSDEECCAPLNGIPYIDLVTDDDMGN